MYFTKNIFLFLLIFNLTISSSFQLISFPSLTDIFTFSFKLFSETLTGTSIVNASSSNTKKDYFNETNNGNNSKICRLINSTNEKGKNNFFNFIFFVLKVSIGMDLSKVTLPTFILERRSLLEMYSEFFGKFFNFLLIL